ncbi:phage tail protein [Escherichia coli]|nr:phage tail protein [Escherichia coli]
MSALLTKAFEKWVAECAASNLPARPDAIIFALMEREPTREDNTVPEEKITYAVNELTYGQLNPNNIVCSAVVPDGCAFSYDWICLIHQASRTLCGVIKTPVRQKHTGESLVRNFTITYQGVAQAAQITVPPQSWQVDITPELKSMLKAPNRLSEIAAEGEDAQQESRDNLGLKSAAVRDEQTDIYDRTEGRLAIPGMFGFGKIFSSSDRTEFKSGTDFLRWVKTAKPGRYTVFADTDVVIPGIQTNGVIEIIWPQPKTNPNDEYAYKIIIYYGVNGHIYYNRCAVELSGGYLVGWENVKFSLTAKDVALWLSKYTYPAYKPDIGALVQAAYSPTSNPENLPLKYGINYSGSYLHPYVFSAPVNGGSAEIHITEDKFLPGTYRGLVNYPELQTEDYMLGLFVRFA